MTAPCKGCVERAQGCHGKCERYKAFKAKREAENNWLREMNQSAQVNRTKYDPISKKYRTPMRRIRT